jgi:hypothetical protein
MAIPLYESNFDLMTSVYSNLRKFILQERDIKNIWLLYFYKAVIIILLIEPLYSSIAKII